MAPKFRSDEKSRNQKCRLINGNRDRAPTPACKRVPSTCKSRNEKETRTVSSTLIKQPENYENLLLFYLTKLKNLFSSAHHPAPTSRENSALKMDKLHHNHDLRSLHRVSSIDHPCRYTSSNSPRPRDYDINSKVFKVVSAALEYGFANNVLEKKGDYFMLKNNRSRIATRQPTPGPRYCEKCCNVHKYLKSSSEGGSNRFSDRLKPMHRLSEKPLHNVQEGKVEKKYGERINNRPCSRPYCGGDRLKVRVHQCPECKALERKNHRM